MSTPRGSSAHISDILFALHGVRVNERTLRDQFRRRGLHREALAAQAKVFGRFEASRPNERWIGDVLVGPFVPHPRVPGSKRAKLFLLVDDHSRLLVHGAWTFEENTRAGQIVLRTAILRRGLPESIYLDNGSPFRAAPLARTCAVLGIHLIHSKPYQPQGRGKQERLNRVIREQFLLEAESVGISDLDQLNDWFMAWMERVVNLRVHGETKETPIARFQAGGPPRAADSEKVADAFRWSERRRVSKTATVSLLGNRYSVEPGLVGRWVELRFDPEDMTTISVWCDGLPAGAATPFFMGTHTHPAVPQAAQPAPPPSGIDYLGMVLEAHNESITGSIAYRDLLSEENDE